MLEFSNTNPSAFSMQWNHDESQMLENAFSLDKPRYSNSYFFCFNCFMSPSRIQSIVFYLRRTICVKIIKNVCCSLIGALTEQTWQKFYWCRHISMIQYIVFKNYSSDSFHQGLMWTCYTIKWLLDWKISDVVPWIGIFIGRKCK